MVRKPASQIIREAEEQLQKAVELRLEALRIEDLAKQELVDLLGLVNGSAAYDIAMWSLNNEDRSDVTYTGEQLERSTPATEKPSEQSSQAPSTGRTKQVQQVSEVASNKVSKIDDVSKNTLYGIVIPAPRMAEAEEIVIQAKSFNSQGRKTNPFANDRGKNAWRKSLFNAVWTSFEGSNVIDAVNEGGDLMPLVHNDEILNTTGEKYTVTNIEDTFFGSDDINVIKNLDDLEIVPIEAEENNSQGSYEEEIERPELDVLTAEPFNDIVVQENDEVDVDQIRIDNHYLANDPFEDELPPPSKLPPPRGYPEGADVGDEELPPARSEIRPVAASMGFSRPTPSGLMKPAVGPPEETAVEQEGKISPHTPMPIPSNRRPGNGQVLQSPTTFPKSLLGSPTNKPAGTINPLSKPPAFMIRKGV